MMIQAVGIDLCAGGRKLLDGVGLSVAAGEFVAIVGPNGAGKSSLLSILAGLRKPASGEVHIDGTALSALSRRAVAQRIALVQQIAETGESLTARQTVELGRTPYLSLSRPFGPADEAAVADALAAVDMDRLADRAWHSLSGGERQRLHFARALAQQTDILILDEPTNHLDIQHQLELLALVRRRPVTVIAALHDLNHALMFADRTLVLAEGRVEGCGPPAQTLTPPLLKRVFRVEAEMTGGNYLRFLAP